MSLLSRVGRNALFGTAAVAGLASGIGSSGREFAMDTAFGDPNADRAFLGSNLSGRFMLGSAMGGFTGGLLQASSPLNYYKTNPTISTSPVASGVAGSAIGGGIGLLRGSPKGALMGAAIGGVMGSVIAPVVSAGSYAASNSRFFAQSPYANRSSATAAALNASGDIVLGMHNSRSSY